MTWEQNCLLFGRKIKRRAVLATAIAVLALYAARLDASQPGVKIGNTPPAITLSDVKGPDVHVPTDFKGKVFILHFFATWCRYCPQEVTALQGLYAKYGSRGLVPLSVDVGEDREKVSSFAQTHRASYTFLLDPSSSGAKAYGVTGIPTTYIVDRSGIVRYRILGEITAEGLEKIVKPLL